MKIVQISAVPFEQLGIAYVVGLGDDNKVYAWQAGKWAILVS